MGKLAWQILEKDVFTFMDKDQTETNIDPLLPIKLSENWLLIFRKPDGFRENVPLHASQHPRVPCSIVKTLSAPLT